MSASLILVLFFGFAFALALAAATVFWAFRPATASTGTSGETTGSALLRDDGLSSIGLWARILERISHVETIERLIREADLTLSVGRMTLTMLLCGTVGAATVLKLSGMPLILTVVGFGLAAWLPYGYLLRRRARRFALFAQQLPDAFDSLARALQAGFPLAVCIETLVHEQPEPLASELKRVRDEWRLGLGWDHAMNGLAARIPIPEVRMFAATVKMQSRTGGKLNLVLNQLGESLRESAAIDGEVRSLSAHSRLSGTILSMLPPAIAFLLFLTNPAYLIDFLNHPTGRQAVALAIIANLAAHFILRRMARIER